MFCVFFSHLWTFSFLAHIWWCLAVRPIQSDLVRTLSGTPAKKDHGHFVGRISSAIVYLANDAHLARGRPQCPTIYDSIRSLKTHMPAVDWHKIDLIIMHEPGMLSSRSMDQIKAVAPCDVRFEQVNLHDHDAQKYGGGQIWRGRDGLDYLEMCNFWSSTFFRLGFLPEYVMRVDTDSCLKSDVPSDPFDTMRSRRIKYMWHSKYPEPAFVIKGLRSFVEQHHTRPDLLGVPKEPNSMAVYSTNLEWFHMPSFREPGIAAWTEQVRQSGGVWTHRWGDAPLRTIAVDQFMDDSDIARFCNFDYGHGDWKTSIGCSPVEGTV